MNDNNVEKIVQQGDYYYFVTKDSLLKPLDSNSNYYSLITFLVKIQVGDRRPQIKEENIPNIRNIFLRQHLPKNPDVPSANDAPANPNVMESILEILKEKLKNNLKRMPSIYTYASVLPNQGLQANV